MVPGLLRLGGKAGIDLNRARSAARAKKRKG